VRSAHRVAPGSDEDRRTDRLDAAIDYPLLVGAGWDLRTKTLTPAREHPLLGYPVCQVIDCELEAWDPCGLCTSCGNHFRASRGADIKAFCEVGATRKTRSRDRHCLICRVPGFERPVGTNDLCSACDGQRRRRQQSVAAYVHGDGDYPPAVPRPSLGSCAVAACQRLAARRDSGLCGAHDEAWRVAGRPELATFARRAAPALGDRSGRVVLAGLDEGLIAEILYGVQAALAEGRRVMPTTLRNVVDHLRRCQVNNVADAVDTAPTRTPVRWFLAFCADRVGLVRASVETEHTKDVWDLRLWGAAGRLSFIGGATSHRHPGTPPSRPIAQAWLKVAAKAWAAETLTTMTAGPVRAVIGAVGLFSEHLARRADAGTDPAALGHADMQAFLVRLAHLQRAETLSAGVRTRSVRLLDRFLRDCREMGLTQPGSVLAGLPEDVVIRRRERPREARRDDAVGRALPEVVLAQLLDSANLDHLEHLAGPTLRAAVELGAAVGRRTAELCGLAFTCLDYDEHVDDDGQRRASPVLVHDMPKVGKFGCRLPIHDREAAIITAQQTLVRVAFPDTPTDRLVLFPRPLKNPDGTKPISTAQLQRMIRTWVTVLPRLDGPERGPDNRPLPFPRERVFPYTFRHTFAQRHADAGTPVDTLKELLGHDTVRTTLGYYRVTTRRKRDAQDKLGPLQIDAHGHRVRPGTITLTDTEAARDQIGQVAVPFGICTEPTNIAAGGHSCPFRHRCTGCEYFRTDPSYTPELRGYLAKLLTDRERLGNAIPELAEWARRDAAPSDAEIDAVRRLLQANGEVLAALDDDDRGAVETAITTIRTQRAQLDVNFPAELAGVVRQHPPVFFPTITRDATTQAGHG
jgi:integrase